MFYALSIFVFISACSIEQQAKQVEVNNGECRERLNK